MMLIHLGMALRRTLIHNHAALALKAQAIFLLALWSALTHGSPIIGTPGNDIINFQGNLQNVTIEATSPTGFSVSLDQVMRVNVAQYDGLEGEDIMFGTSAADYLNGEDVKNIETFQFGGGNDFADFSNYTQSATYYLSTGNDILFGSPHDDVVYAGPGDDFIDTGDGLDVIFGQSGKNRIAASLGLNLIYGGTDEDTLIFNPGVTSSDLVEIYLLDLDTILPTGHFFAAGSLYGRFHNFNGAESAFYAQDVQWVAFLESVYRVDEFVTIVQSSIDATVSEPSTMVLLLLALALLFAKHRRVIWIGRPFV